MAIWGTVCCSLFFCSKFCSSIRNRRCRGKIFNVACYVTYGRMACGILYKKNADTIYGDIMRNVREKLAETVGKELDNVADNLQKIAEERQKKEECKAILEKLSEKIDKLCNEIEAGGAV